MHYQIRINSEFGQIEFIKEYPEEIKPEDVIKEYQPLLGKPLSIIPKEEMKKEIQQELIEQATKPDVRRFIYKSSETGKFIDCDIDINNGVCPNHDTKMGRARKDKKYNKLYFFCQKCADDGISNGYFNYSKFNEE